MAPYFEEVLTAMTGETGLPQKFSQSQFNSSGIKVLLKMTHSVYLSPDFCGATSAIAINGTSN